MKTLFRHGHNHSPLVDPDDVVAVCDKITISQLGQQIIIAGTAVTGPSLTSVITSLSAKECDRLYVLISKLRETSNVTKIRDFKNKT